MLANAFWKDGCRATSKASDSNWYLAEHLSAGRLEIRMLSAGKIQVTVTPKDTTATAFFIKAELVK